jgi:hypothetical protein
MKANSRRLPIGLQIIKINSLLQKRGISKDLIDVNARIDRTLTYRENVRGISNYIGKNIYPAEIRGKTSSYELFLKAQDVNDKRSLRSRNVDYRRRAKKTYYPDDLTQKQYLNWRRNPARHDIEGVDTRGGF